jgi:hypothetical protein
MSNDRPPEAPIAVVRHDRPARIAAPFELIAIVLLALSTLVAVTAVSIGFIRADLQGADRTTMQHRVQHQSQIPARSLS